LIKLHEQHSNVLIALVRTVGEQAQVCGIDLDQRIHELFPILINMMQDTSNYRKREVALWTIGQIVESCCYVIEPLQKYPILLDVLLQFLKSPEEIPFRRETIRVLGFLGAIDPYDVRTSNDPLRSSSFDVNDITLTHRARTEPDPIDISSNELLVASSAQSLQDFYTSMAIYVCLRLLKDSNSPQLHLKAVQAISIILQWLSINCTQYVSLVLPRLISIVRGSEERNLTAYFRQINIIIISVKGSIINYIDDIVQLIRDYWDTNFDVQILLIQTIESLAAALESEFRHHIHLLLPFVMKIFRIDVNQAALNMNTNQNQDRQMILSQMFSTLNKFGKTLKPHFNVVLPSILDIASTDTYPNKLRQEALDTIEQLADKVFLSDYVSAILQILLRIIRQTPQLQNKCLDIILIIAQQMGKRFIVFSKLVAKTIEDMKLQHSKYELYISKLLDPSYVDVQTETMININSIVTHSSSEHPKKTDDKMLYTMRTDQLRHHWINALQRNAKDIPMWLIKFQQLVLEQSPVYPLRAMGTCLSQVSPSIPKDLFNASFISFWSELNVQDRQSLTIALTHVLRICDKPDVIQVILNLAEFRNHCDLKLKIERQQKNQRQHEDISLHDANDDTHNDRDKTNRNDTNSDHDDQEERSLINIQLLSEKAFSVRAYAKALKYKEEEFQRQHNSTSASQASVTSDIVESLISINHELQQSEAAYGALQYAKHHNIKIKGLWYEKLNQWERALRNYEFLKINDPFNMDIHLGRMRCMQALGSWAELKDLASQVWELTDQINDEQSSSALPFTTSLVEKNSTSSLSYSSSQGLINGRDLKKTLQQKIAPMATRAAWSLGDMTDMEKYFIHIPDTKFEGAYYRAVDAIRNDNYRQAQDSIDLARELLDVELTTLANESYNRAYSGKRR
jgi:serine/threonine-protein kinase mTOR